MKLFCSACGVDLEAFIYYGFGWKEPQQLLVCRFCYKAMKVYNDE